jgi:hypothetical protein
MAMMRGVEQGFTDASVARRGRLTLSGNRGRVAAEAIAKGGGAKLVGAPPLHNTHTLYARWSDWFARLDTVARVAWIVIAVSSTAEPGNAASQSPPGSRCIGSRIARIHSSATSREASARQARDMDRCTIDAYDNDAAAFADDRENQPSPDDLYALLTRYSLPGPTAEWDAARGAKSPG